VVLFEELVTCRLILIYLMVSDQCRCQECATGGAYVVLFGFMASISRAAVAVGIGCQVQKIR